MKIEIILSADEIEEKRIKGKAVVAIDTLRATTTVVTALANGAREVIPVLNVEEALDYHNLKGEVVIAGERKGEKIPEMDLGNSPESYIEQIVKGKKVILTTTNGTKMLLKLEKACQVVIASFVNLQAVAQKIKNEETLIICCAGTQGRFSLEDFITAGGIIDRLKELNIDLELTDLSLVAYQSYVLNKDRLLEVLSQSKNGNRLISLGKKRDIDYASQEDFFSLVPIYSNGKITI